MCTALEDLKKEGVKEGIQEGEVKGTIKTCKKFNLDQDATIKNIMSDFSLSKEEALTYIRKYW